MRGHHRHGARAQAQGDRRGCRKRRTARVPAHPSLRSGAGLPDQPADPGSRSGAAATKSTVRRRPTTRGSQTAAGGRRPVMQWLSNLTLRAKLRVIVVYAAAVAVLIASAMYASGEVLTLRRSEAEQLLMLLTAVGETAAPMLKSPNAAPVRKALAALHANPEIRAAALYDAGGRLLADVSFGAETGSSPERLRAWAIDAAGSAAAAIQFNGLTGVEIDR